MSQEQARSSDPGPDLQEAALLIASVFNETYPGSIAWLPDGLPYKFQN